MLLFLDAETSVRFLTAQALFLAFFISPFRLTRQDIDLHTPVQKSQQKLRY